MTNELRKIIMDRLSGLATTFGITEIGYRQVQDDTLFPHIVVDFSSIQQTDMGRTDFFVDINIWAKDNAVAFNILDSCKKKFAFWNAPSYLTGQTILPTFYEESGGQIEDPDKTIIHLVLRVQGQAYNKTASNSSIIWQS